MVFAVVSIERRATLPEQLGLVGIVLVPKCPGLIGTVIV
jgi:hypothetical protein